MPRNRSCDAVTGVACCDRGGRAVIRTCCVACALARISLGTRLMNGITRQKSNRHLLGVALVSAALANGCMFFIPHHERPKAKAAAPAESHFEEGIALTKRFATDPDFKVRRTGGTGEVVRYYVLVPDWVINRNEISGRITDRSFGNLIFYRGGGMQGNMNDKAGACYAVNCGVREEELNGSWGKPQWNCGYPAEIGAGGCKDVEALRPSDG